MLENKYYTAINLDRQVRIPIDYVLLIGIQKAMHKYLIFKFVPNCDCKVINCTNTNCLL